MSGKVDLRLDWCSHEAAKFAIERWYYTRSMPMGKRARIGVWEDGKFVGCVMFGGGSVGALGKRYGLQMTECVEMTRVAMGKHRSQMSRILRVAVLMLRKAFPKLRLIVTFADKDHGHHGGIYQAAGWIYTGETEPYDDYVVAGERVDWRTFRHRFGDHEKSPYVRTVASSTKHRYVLPLDDEMRARVASLAQPRPKRAGGVVDCTPVFQAGGDGSIPIPALHFSEAIDGKAAPDKG